VCAASAEALPPVAVEGVTAPPGRRVLDEPAPVLRRRGALCREVGGRLRGDPSGV